MFYGLNTEIYSVNLRNQFKYRKIRTRKNFVFGDFSPSEYSIKDVWQMFAKLIENHYVCQEQRFHTKFRTTGFVLALRVQTMLSSFFSKTYWSEKWIIFDKSSVFWNTHFHTFKWRIFFLFVCIYMNLFRLQFVKGNFEIIDKHHVMKLTSSFLWRLGKKRPLFSWFLITTFYFLWTCYSASFFFENPVKRNYSLNQ